jgi:hypothetical protein
MNALVLICMPCLAIGLLGLYVAGRALYELRRARRLLGTSKSYTCPSGGHHRMRKSEDAMKLGFFTVTAALTTSACGGTAFSIVDVPVATDAGDVDAYREGAPHGDDIGDTGFIDVNMKDSAPGDASTEGDSNEDAAESSSTVDAADAGVDTGGTCVADGTYNCSYGSKTTTYDAKVQYCAVSLQGTGMPFASPTPPSCQTCGGYTCACVTSGTTPCTMGVYACQDTSSGPVLLCN